MKFSVAAVVSALGAALVLSCLIAGPVSAAQNDPAAARIETFDAALIDTLKSGPTLGVKGRYHKLAPVIEQMFDLPAMTRFAVGPAWATMSEPDHEALLVSFTRLSIAKYAHNFDRFDGERFTIDGNVQTRGGVDKIVQSRLIPGHGVPVDLIYRLRQSGGTWKIIDIYYDRISQLTTQRSDFTQSLASGGAKGLKTHLDALSDKLMR